MTRREKVFLISFLIAAMLVVLEEGRISNYRNAENHKTRRAVSDASTARAPVPTEAKTSSSLRRVFISRLTVMDFRKSAGPVGRAVWIYQILPTAADETFQALALKPGDYLLEVNGISPSSLEDLILLLADFPERPENSLKVLRGDLQLMIRYSWDSDRLISHRDEDTDRERPQEETLNQTGSAPNPLDTVSESKASDHVRTLLSKLIEIQDRLPGDGNLLVRRTEMTNAAATYFNFQEIARRSVGVGWEKFSERQQEEFISVLSKVFLRFYIEKIDQVSRQLVSIEGESVNPGAILTTAVVKTNIQQTDGLVSVDYRLLNSGNGWQIIDLIIEQVGMVSNYRNEFPSIIRTEGIDALIARLKQKQAASPRSAGAL